MTRCFLSTVIVLMTIPLHLLAGEIPFEKVLIDPEFKAEGCAVADINRDGKPDIVAGDTWYEAPDWKRHEFRTVGMVGSYRDVRYDYPEDVNGDGWTDLLTVRFEKAVVWFENPEGEETQWKEHSIAEFALCEGVYYGDVDGDGEGDFVGPHKPPALAWCERTDDPYAPWILREIGSRGGDRHGIGIGDINRDGRNDVLTAGGWFEAPPDRRHGKWTFHKGPIGDCFVLYAYDVSGDGDTDVLSSSPHNYGVWGWEQTNPGRLIWESHVICKTFSQAHALALVDMDGDGDKDLVTGKRYYAHEGRDPGADEPAVLLWLELARDGGKVQWSLHQLDDNSGVGYQIAVEDIDGDGNLDIVTSNKKGLFLFRNKSPRKRVKLFRTPKDLDQWVGDQTLWAVENGILVGRSPGIPRNTFLVSKREYRDVILTLSVRLKPDTGNSGIQFRSEVLEDGEVKGYQADIGAGWWGSLYEEQGRGLLVDAYKKKGDKAVQEERWNDYVVRAIGDRIQIEINGTVTTDIRDTERSQGRIAFQIHSGGAVEVAFKDVFLKEIVEEQE